MESTIKKNIAILCNPLAGAGRAVVCAEKISAALSKGSIDCTLFKETWPNNFSGFTDVFIVGGDGTLNYFINHYPGIQLPLVIFSGGTGNDFHWLLYGNKTFEEQLQIALNENPRLIDLGKCNERYFINGVGIGFEGEVARALAGKRKFSGKTSFLITVLKKIFTYRSGNYSIQMPGHTITGKKFLVDISNGRRAGGGFHIAPVAQPDDGVFDVVIVDALGPAKRLHYLPVIEKGQHLNLSFVQFYNSMQILVESDRMIQYHLDGEYFEAKKLAIEILPAVVHFRF